MSHHSQNVFLQSCAVAFPEYFNSTAVLEMGSADINGSTRHLFHGGKYVGVDLVPSLGVDVVGIGHEVRLGIGTFDVALSCECFEHNPYWRETLVNMLLHLKPNGMFIITCAAPGRPEHGTRRSQPSYSLSTQLSWSYYRNVSEQEIVRVLHDVPRKNAFRSFYRRSEADLYLIGVVDPVPMEVPDRLAQFTPRWKSDKSLAERAFLTISGILESHCYVSPYVICRCHRALARIYVAAKAILVS